MKSRSETVRCGRPMLRAPAVVYSVDTQSETVCLHARNNSIQQQQQAMPLALLSNSNNRPSTARDVTYTRNICRQSDEQSVVVVACDDEIICVETNT